MPASAGEQGPGDRTSWSGCSPAMPSSVISSVRKTRTSSPSSPVLAEVVGVRADHLSLMPYGSVQGFSAGCEVVALGSQSQVGVGEGLLGRVIDGFGEPLDGLTAPTITERRSLRAPPINPMQRPRITRPLETGVRAIDSLLTLERDRAVEFVGRFMKSTDPETRDEAALALGASRLTSAVEKLIDVWKESRGREFGPVVLRALSSSRDEAALNFLLGIVKEGLSRDAAAALEALTLHADSQEIQARIAQAKEERGTGK